MGQTGFAIDFETSFRLRQLTVTIKVFGAVILLVKLCVSLVHLIGNIAKVLNSCEEYYCEYFPAISKIGFQTAQQKLKKLYRRYILVRK